MNCYIMHGSLVDEETGKLLQVGTGTNPKEDKNVDLHGQYVMSGLINAHTHVGLVNAAKEHYPETKLWLLIRP